MNYKQKYEEALERAKLSRLQLLNIGEEATEIEYIFPELRESEDEEIRKALIDYFDDANKVDENPLQSYGIHTDKAIAWLEKQGEKTIPKNIDDAALQYVDTCAVDGRVTHDNINEPYWNNHSMMNAYKAGWLEKQDEQHAWNEEDEKMKNLIISTLTSVGTINLERYYHMNFDEVENWLKSIKPNHWKPSEEQMEALNAINNVGELSYVEQADLLIKLYNDLKKL